jgi:hypothetical protein
VNCTDSLFTCVAGKNCEYFLLTEGDTCGLVFSNVVISFLFDYMLIDVWHLICVTCIGWDYGCDTVCMIIPWCDISLNKKSWGLGTKASMNWGNQRIKFRY